MKKILAIICIALTGTAFSQNYPSTYSIDQKYEIFNSTEVLLSHEYGGYYVNAGDTIVISNFIVFDTISKSCYLESVWIYDADSSKSYNFIFEHGKYEFKKTGGKMNIYVPEKIDMGWWEMVISPLLAIRKGDRIYLPISPEAATYFQESMIGFKAINTKWFKY